MADTPNSPTLGEIVRRLDEIVRRLDEMARQAVEREKQLVRRDVFEAVQAADALQMRGMENEVHSVGKRLDALDQRLEESRKDVERRFNEAAAQQTATRRWAVGAVVIPSVSVLIALIGLVLLVVR